MAFLGYEQVTVSDSVLTVDDLTIPTNATHAELQAQTQAVNYTMDGSTDPTQDTGMILAVGDPPKTFPIEEIRAIKFVRGAASDGQLNLHYR